MQQSTIKSFFGFLKKPDYNRLIDLTTRQKITILFKLFLLTFVLLIIVKSFNKLLVSFGLYEEAEHYIKNISNVIPKEFASKFLIFALIINPILEELCFRLPLNWYNRKHISISFALIIGYLLYQVFGVRLWHSNSALIFGIIPYFYIISFSTPFMFLILILLKKFDFKTESIWNKYPVFIFYSSVIMFSIIHIAALNIEFENYIYLPIILLPYIVYGTILGYTRIRLGLFYAVTLHILLNTPMFLKILLNL